MNTNELIKAVQKKRNSAKDMDSSLGKILYLTTFDPTVPLSGGPARAREYIRFLAERYTVFVVNMQGNTRPPELIQDDWVRAFQNDLRRVAGKQEVPYNRVGCFSFSTRLFQAAVRVMRKEKFDLIIADMSNASFYGYLLSKMFRVPWIYSSRNVEYKRHLEGARLDIKKYALVPLMYLAERLGSKAQRLLTVSEFDASHFRKWTDPTSVVVIPSGFDESQYHPYYEPIASPRPTVLFFGAFTHLPNREAALIIMNNILPRVVEQFPDVIFQFAGSEPPSELAHPNTEILGFVSDLVWHIRRANVVIAPILSGGGMRTKVVESLACGKVVISTVKGAEGIGEYRNLLLRNIQEFSNEICCVIREGRFVDETDFENLRKAHSWREILERINRCVKDVIAQTRGDTRK